MPSQLLLVATTPSALHWPRTAPRSPAGRVAFHYGLKGPAVSVDTACSSSLVATNSARESLLSGGGGAAVAGGINMMLLPTTTAMFKKAGMLSADGRCKALDATADGYVRSEVGGAWAMVGARERQREPGRAPLSARPHSRGCPRLGSMVCGTGRGQE